MRFILPHALIMHCVTALSFNIYKVNKVLAQSQICILSVLIELAHITSRLIILEK